MKKLSTYLFLILFSFSAPSFADDISEFQIEGISIGDSLLDYMSKEKALSEKEKSKEMYSNLGKQIFFEAYSDAFDNYDYISFFVKSDDRNFIIQAIYAVKYYKENIDKCYSKQKEIAAELDHLFKNEKKYSEHEKINWDSSGKSTLKRTVYKFSNGDIIAIECYDWHESYQTEDLPNPDILSLSINRKDVYSWINP